MPARAAASLLLSVLLPCCAARPTASLQPDAALGSGASANSSDDFALPATAAAARDGLKEFVFVKVHQVGGETIKVILDDVWRASPVLNNTRTVKLLDDHKKTLNLLDDYAAHGEVPKGTWATTIMRNPADKFFSWWFLVHFFAGAGVQVQGAQSLKEAEKMAPQLSDYVTSRKWSSTWETKGIERYFREMKPEKLLRDRSMTEYTTHFRDAANSRSVLKQFKLVGLTENEDCYAAQLCVLIGLQPQVCLESMQKESTHQRPPHPSLSDFSAEFQSWFKQMFAEEFAIYDIAKEMSERSDTGGCYQGFPHGCGCPSAGGA